MKEYGYCRVTAVTPKVAIGNVSANLEEHIRVINEDNFGLTNDVKDYGVESDVIVFPELSLTGYTCEDLFFQRSLQKQALDALQRLATLSEDWRSTVLVGLPVFMQEDATLRNCVAVIGGGRVLGIVPKTFLPNYREFYEARWFASAKPTDPQMVNIGIPEQVPFGADLLFSPKRYGNTAWTFGVEICEDVWSPIPPSSFQALAGATVLFNLSASNETIGKSEYRRNFVKGQSGKLMSAYVYCSAGPTESTKDLVFGGHNIIGEGGNIVAESEKFVRHTHTLTADIDVERLLSERASMPGTFAECATRNMKPFRFVEYQTDPLVEKNQELYRHVEAHPFVPKNHDELKARCAEIFGIQTAGLAKRLERVSKDTYIGVSGGLDSTLALLVACKAYDMLGIDRKHLHGITMPGFGTTNRTKTNANVLMDNLGISQKTIDIREMCVQTWRDMKHIPFGDEECFVDGRTMLFSQCLHQHTVVERYEEPKNILPEELTVKLLEECLKFLPYGAQDLIFENVQARVRTLILMSHGFVLGTGDLSELALGWCTYNGDHMSMYNVNCSIPKTLVKFLVEYIADHEVDKTWLNRNETYHCLLDIVKTPISPELLPTKKGEIQQETEESVGPYVLHDWFMYNLIRNGFSPSKIMFLAQYVEFKEGFDIEVIGKWLKFFYKRFFTQQFKRDCVPAGPKVGSVSLSPRGDWRMPPDADPDAWIAEVDTWLKIHRGEN